MSMDNSKNNDDMERAIVITDRVVRRLMNMPLEERRIMFSTLASDEILKVDRDVVLTPEQELMYLVIHDSIMRDSERWFQSSRDSSN